MQLRDARLVDPDAGPDLLHRDLAEVVEPDDLALARRQGLQGLANAVAGLGRLVGAVGHRRLRRNAEIRQHHVWRAVRRGRQHRRRFNGADANDGPAQPDLVGPDPGGQVGQGRLGTGLAADRFARRLELATLSPNPTRPGVLAQRVDHGAADAALGERLELDAATIVVAMRGVDQAHHPVLHQIAQVDRVRHRRSHPAGNGFDERQAGDDAVLRGHELDGGVGHGRLRLAVSTALASAIRVIAASV
jgi:hypothetical protein